MKDERRLSWGLTALFGALIVLMAVGTDAWWWVTIDRFQAPIRSMTYGDQDYYAYRAHRAILEGGPIGHPFHENHADSLPRFVVFESVAIALARVLPPLAANPVVLMNAFRALAALGSLLALAALLRRVSGWPRPTALAAAFAFLMWAARILFQEESVLLGWMIPLHILGLLASVRAWEQEASAEARLAWSLASVFAFSTHPFSYALGAVANGFLWLGAFARERSAKTFARSVIWGAATLALGFGLYGGFLWRASSESARETFARAPAIFTRLPLNPLIIAATFSVFLLLVACRRAAKDERDGARWDVLVVYAGVTAFATISNLVSGTYYLLDHFVFLLPFLLAAGAAMALRRPPETTDKLARLIAAAGSALAVFVFVKAAFLTGLRGILALSDEAAAFACAAVLAAWTFGVVFPPKRARLALILAVLLSTATVFTFMWRLNHGDAAEHARAQALRPLIAELRTQPAGVIMADPWVSDVLIMHTPHLPYWSWRAFIDDATTREFQSRWIDTLAFFRADDHLKEQRLFSRLIGLQHFICTELRDAGRGLTQEECPIAFKDAQAIESFVRTSEASSRGAAVDGSWLPRHDLGWLVLDAEGDPEMPAAMRDRFSPVWTDGRFTLYRYLENGKTAP